ncbi:hypothetical protein CH063_07894, partial [Colletotrichum higginsianum]
MNPRRVPEDVPGPLRPPDRQTPIRCGRDDVKHALPDPEVTRLRQTSASILPLEEELEAPRGRVPIRLDQGVRKRHGDGDGPVSQPLDVETRDSEIPVRAPVREHGLAHETQPRHVAEVASPPDHELLVAATAEQQLLAEPLEGLQPRRMNLDDLDAAQFPPPGWPGDSDVLPDADRCVLGTRGDVPAPRVGNRADLAA